MPLSIHGFEKSDHQQEIQNIFLMHEADEDSAWFIKAIKQPHTVHKFKYK